MHSSGVLGLSVLGASVFQAVAADNAHLKVQFFSDPFCQHMKPDNDDHPSDLNPRKNECEVPDHHLPAEGFGFKSIKYYFKGSDWKKNWSKKYNECSLFGFHEKMCENGNGDMLKPGWSLGNNSVFKNELMSTSECHTLGHVAPFYALMLNCEEQKQPIHLTATSDVVVVPWPTTKTETYVVSGITTKTTEVQMAQSTVTHMPSGTMTIQGTHSASVVITYGPGSMTVSKAEDVVSIMPTITTVQPGATTIIRPQATVTGSPADLARRRLHARDVTAKSVSSAPAAHPTSVEAVISEEDFLHLVETLGQDLNQWIHDLDTAVEKAEDDSEEVECEDGDCEEEGDDLWPCGGDCESDDEDSSCDGKATCSDDTQL